MNNPKGRRRAVQMPAIHLAGRLEDSVVRGQTRAGLGCVVHAELRLAEFHTRRYARRF